MPNRRMACLGWSRPSWCSNGLNLGQDRRPCALDEGRGGNPAGRRLTMSSRRTNLLLRQMAAVFQYSARVAGDPAGSAPPAERHQLFYRAVMEASPLAMALADFELRLLSVNPAFEALFGYRRADIVGASLPILVNREATLAEAVGEGRRTGTKGFA